MNVLLVRVPSPEYRMLTIQQVRRIIQVGNYLRRNGKDDAADELFVALVAKLDAEPVSGVWLAYNYERPMLKPRTHSLMVRAGEDFFEMDRSHLAAPIFLAHRWPEANSASSCGCPRANGPAGALRLAGSARRPARSVDDRG